MKKIFLLMLAMMTLMLTACGNTDAANPKGDKILVAYFSCTGNTKNLAQTTANAVNADLFEIKAKIPYSSDDLNWHDKNTRSSIEMNDPHMRPEIADKIENFDQYSTIILAYPIWWNQEPRIIDTFLESYDFTNIKIIPICTSGGSEINSSVNGIKKLVPKAKVTDGQRFNSSASDKEIKNWISEKL